MEAWKENLRRGRIKAANALIGTIADTGHKFFYHKGNLSTLWMDERGRVWLRDGYTGKDVYTHNETSRWRGFSEGGTLRSLVCHLRRYIQKGTPLPRGVLGPWHSGMCGGDIWGYGEDMQKVRDKANELGITRQEAPNA